MNPRSDVEGRPGLTLQTRRRTIGPYEEWIARTIGRQDLPEFMIARRPDPDRSDPDVLSQRLKLGAQRAIQVEHHLTVQCFGFLEPTPGHVVQVLAWHPGPLLESLMKHHHDLRPPLPPAAAVWIARQILDAIAHAHGLGLVHGVLSPAHVWVEQSGELKVDFALSVGRRLDVHTTDYIDLRYVRSGLSTAPPAPATDLYAVGSILHDLLTGAPPRSPDDRSSVRARVPSLPEPIDAAIMAALDATTDARGLAAQLDHVFYAVLEGDDMADGQVRVAHWLHQVDPDSSAGIPVRIVGSPGTPDPIAGASGLTEPADEPTVAVQGVFTRAVLARDQPVAPQDFSPEDYVTASPGDGWPAVDEPEAETVAVTPAEPETQPGTPTTGRLTSAARPTVGSPTSTAPHVASLSPDAPVLSRGRTHPAGLPSPSLSRPHPPPPSAFVWMTFGFALTLFMIMVWTWLTPAT